MNYRRIRKFAFIQIGIVANFIQRFAFFANRLRVLEFNASLNRMRLETTEVSQVESEDVITKVAKVRELFASHIQQLKTI